MIIIPRFPGLIDKDDLVMVERSKPLIERVNCGFPLIAADPDSWDDGFTLNPTAIRLERSAENDGLIRNILMRDHLDDPRLHDGVFAVFYRGIPKEVEGKPKLRSSVGLAVFTPDFRLVKRFPYPVVVPSDDPMDCDYNGVEDQRITRIGDTFYMLYCGLNYNYPREHNIRVSMATSKDLINWEKLGPVRGDVNDYPNKDAVMLPDAVDGKYLMLHRPMVGEQNEFDIALAISDSPTGEWQDLGSVMSAVQDPRYPLSWLGAGSTPIPIGNNRYLCDYHIGNYRETWERDYSAGYAILNFNGFKPNRPETVVEARWDYFMEPTTQFERDSPWPHDFKLNCVFPAGSFEYRDDIIIFYGGADAFVLGARINKQDLIAGIRSEEFRPIAHRQTFLANRLQELEIPTF